jgi:hypothetical protein
VLFIDPIYINIFSYSRAIRSWSEDGKWRIMLPGENDRKPISTALRVPARPFM